MMKNLFVAISGLFMLSGVFFCFASVVGLIRFPDVYTRLHAGTKALSGGVVLILAGVALRTGSWQGSGKALLIVLFLLGTNPLASHAIARACYRNGLIPWGVDVEGCVDGQKGVDS